MKNIISLVIMTVFLSQSLLTSYLYAAEPTSTRPAAENTQSATQQLIDRFLKMDLSSVDAISVLQVAAYLYVYEKHGPA